MAAIKRVAFVLGIAVGMAVLAPLARADVEQDVSACTTSAGDSAQRVAACTRVIESGRYAGADSAWAFFQRGRAQAASGALDAAIADFTQAITLAPSSPAYHARAEAYRLKGLYDSAIADANAALRNADAAAEPNISATRGAAYAARGLYDAALGDLDSALAAAPQSVFALTERGAVYRAKREWDKSLADFDAALKLSPSAYVYKARGKTYFFMDKFDLARADFDQAIKLNPGDGESYQLRGECQRSLGQLDLAIGDATQAITFLPGIAGANAYLSRGAAYLAKGEPDAALRDFDKSIELNPEHGFAHEQRAHAFEAKRDVVNALAAANEAMRLSPTIESAYRNYICWIHATIGTDMEAALAACDFAVKMKPAVPMSLNARGVVYFKLGRMQDALEAFDVVTQIDPDYVAALYCRGVVKSKQGDSAGGIVDMEAAKAVYPPIADVYAKFGVAP